MPDENDTSGSTATLTGLTYMKRAEPVTVADARGGHVCQTCNCWAPARYIKNVGGVWHCKDHAPVYSDAEFGQIMGELKKILSRT